MRKLIYANGKEFAKRYVGERLVWRKKTLMKQTFYTKSTLSPYTYSVYDENIKTEILLRQRFEAEDVKEVIFMGKYKFTKDDFLSIRSGEYDSQFWKSKVKITFKKTISDMIGSSDLIPSGTKIEVYYYG